MEKVLHQLMWADPRMDADSSSPPGWTWPWNYENTRPEKGVKTSDFDTLTHIPIEHQGFKVWWWLRSSHLSELTSTLNTSIQCKGLKPTFRKSPLTLTLEFSADHLIIVITNVFSTFTPPTGKGQLTYPCRELTWSQLWKRKIIFKSVLEGDIMLVPRRVSRIFRHVRHYLSRKSRKPRFYPKIPSIFPSLGGRVVLASLQWFSHLIGEVWGCWRLEELCWILGLQTPWYWGGGGWGWGGGNWGFLGCDVMGS